MTENTRNLADFGYRELGILRDILTAWIDGGGLPDDFYEDEVVPEFNPNSGEVFLTNSDGQVAVLAGDELVSFYILSNSGHEGTFEDLVDEVLNDYWDLDDGYELDDLADLIDIAKSIDADTSIIEQLQAKYNEYVDSGEEEEDEEVF